MSAATRGDLDGKVAWVTGGGEGAGRATALLLAALGASVLVTGPKERLLGQVVGEITNGAGKARHLAGVATDEAHLLAAIEKASSTFGGIDVVVVVVTNDDELPGAEATFRTASKHVRAGGRFVLLHALPKNDGEGQPFEDEAAVLSELRVDALSIVRALPRRDLAPKVTANAIFFVERDFERKTVVAGDGSADREVSGSLTEEDAARLVEFLVSARSGDIDGLALGVTTLV